MTIIDKYLSKIKIIIDEHVIEQDRTFCDLRMWKQKSCSIPSCMWCNEENVTEEGLKTQVKYWKDNTSSSALYFIFFVSIVFYLIFLIFRTEFDICAQKCLHEEEVNEDCEILLRTAAIKHPVGLEQGFVRCNCTKKLFNK